MSDPRGRYPWRRTEELPSTRSGGGTERLSTGSRPAPRRPSRLPLAWLVVGVLAVLLIFFVGFLAGRAGVAEPGAAAGGKERRACVRAATVSARLTRLHQQALVNRVAFARALSVGAKEELETLDAQLRELSGTIEELRERSAKALQRCRG